MCPALAKPNMPGSNFWECQTQRRGKTFLKYWEFQQIRILMSWYTFIMLIENDFSMFMRYYHLHFFSENRFERYAFQLWCSLNQLKKQEKMARWNRAKESKDIFELLSSWSLDDFCLYLGLIFGILKTLERKWKKPIKRSHCASYRTILFKLIQKWELLKVYD